MIRFLPQIHCTYFNIFVGLFILCYLAQILITLDHAHSLIHNIWSEIFGDWVLQLYCNCHLISFFGWKTGRRSRFLNLVFTINYQFPCPNNVRIFTNPDNYFVGFVNKRRMSAAFYFNYIIIPLWSRKLIIHLS